uniref:Nucleolar protein 16 n=1 Tax=Anser cygnoides TaxID=8845 RepID=A0A8B9EIZ4_ANSCY
SRRAPGVTRCGGTPAVSRCPSPHSSHIRHAWDSTKSVAQNLAEMGLAKDPNKALPIAKSGLLVSAGGTGSGGCRGGCPHQHLGHPQG